MKKRQGEVKEKKEPKRSRQEEHDPVLDARAKDAFALLNHVMTSIYQPEQFASLQYSSRDHSVHLQTLLSESPLLSDEEINYLVKGLDDPILEEKKLREFIGSKRRLPWMDLYHRVSTLIPTKPEVLSELMALYFKILSLGPRVGQWMSKYNSLDLSCKKAAGTKRAVENWFLTKAAHSEVLLKEVEIFVVILSVRCFLKLRQYGGYENSKKAKASKEFQKCYPSTLSRGLEIDKDITTLSLLGAFWKENWKEHQFSENEIVSRMIYLLGPVHSHSDHLHLVVPCIVKVHQYSLQKEVVKLRDCISTRTQSLFEILFTHHNKMVAEWILVPINVKKTGPLLDRWEHLNHLLTKNLVYDKSLKRFYQTDTKPPDSPDLISGICDIVNNLSRGIDNILRLFVQDLYLEQAHGLSNDATHLYLDFWLAFHNDIPNNPLNKFNSSLTISDLKNIKYRFLHSTSHGYRRVSLNPVIFYSSDKNPLIFVQKIRFFEESFYSLQFISLFSQCPLYIRSLQDIVLGYFGVACPSDSYLASLYTVY